MARHEANVHRSKFPPSCGSLPCFVTGLFVFVASLLSNAQTQSQQPDSIAAAALPIRTFARLPRPVTRTPTPSVFESTAPAGFALFDYLFADQSRRSTSPRLAGVPNMFGDFSFSGIHISQFSSQSFTADAPLAGGSRGFKLAENGKALPQDRVYYMYHHFHNAMEVNTVAFSETSLISLNSLSVDRHTFGFERTFQDGWSSVDVRMHVTGGADYADPIVRIETGNLGDLSFAFKRLLYNDDYTAYSTGVGVTLPTGSDVEIFGPGASGPPVDTGRFRIHNDSVHISPFLAGMYHPNDLFFYQAIAQIDVPLNGNRIDGGLITSPVGEGPVVGGPVVESGILNEQPLLFVDLSAGVWLWKNPDAEWNRGLAAVLEFHYTSTMGNPDTVFLPSAPGIPRASTHSFDISNFTLGLHWQLTHGTNVRVAGVFPLENSGSTGVFDDDDRLFDAEFQLQINRQY